MSDIHLAHSYIYSIDVSEEPSGLFRGRIFIKAHQDSGRIFEPPFIVETRAAFKQERAAKREAWALAQEIIDANELVESLPAEIARHDLVKALLP